MKIFTKIWITFLFLNFVQFSRSMEEPENTNENKKLDQVQEHEADNLFLKLPKEILQHILAFTKQQLISMKKDRASRAHRRHKNVAMRGNIFLANAAANKIFLCGNGILDNCRFTETCIRGKYLIKNSSCGPVSLESNFISFENCNLKSLNIEPIESDELQIIELKKTLIADKIVFLGKHGVVVADGESMVEVVNGTLIIK